MTTTSDSEEDCLVLVEGEACVEDGSSVGEERLREACEGAEAMVSRSRSGNEEGDYCIGGVVPRLPHALCCWRGVVN
jgi:hypothetical protein